MLHNIIFLRDPFNFTCIGRTENLKGLGITFDLFALIGIKNTWMLKMKKQILVIDLSVSLITFFERTTFKGDFSHKHIFLTAAVFSQ